MNDPPIAERGQRTLAAIVVTDAVDFSARMAADEEATLALIQRDLELSKRLCLKFEGRVLKSTGDGLLLYFASAVQAVSCGLAIQQELTRINAGSPPGKTLLHRIGIHLGDVFFSQSDVMGTGVNIAARLQTAANPGELCISKIVYDVVKSRLSLNVTDAGHLKLKNIQEPVPAYYVSIKPVGAAQEPSAAASGSPADSSEAVKPPSQHFLQPGNRVAGRYVIQRLLGQGGFGRSYLAIDMQRFEEACVLKEFVPTQRSSRSLEKAVNLFKREAKTLYQLDHPQVPKFLACFTQSHRLFIVQEFIDGVTYAQLLRQRRRQGTKFTEAEILPWLEQMLRVLDHLHGLKIVHRDISPDNIIHSRDRNLPVLIDFGLVNDAVSDLLAHAESDEGAAPGKRATMVGKFGYSPPEQIQMGQCYPCSDLYALAVTTIVLLSGRYPKELLDRDSLEWQWQAHVQLSDGLERVLRKLLQRQPKNRFQSAQEVMAALNLDSSPSEMLPPTTLYDPGPAFEVPDEPLSLRSPSALQLPDFIEQCQRELARCIGPMASMVIEDVLAQYPDASPQQLVDRLAEQLSNADQATAFISRIDIPSSDLSTAAVPSQAGSAAAAASTAGMPASVDEAFVQRCRQALARCIGPMANFLIEETLAEYPHLDSQQLVRRLAAEIPDGRQAEAFQRQLL